MESIIAIIALLLCVSSPIFFGVAIYLGVVLFNQKKNHELNVAELSRRINILSKDALSGLRLKWFDEIVVANYGNEVEVEIKFIYPFMRFLGYDISDLKTRVSVNVPVGRQKVTGIADWVVFKNQQGNPFLIIEAKEQNQKLNGAVQEQARSYAYALNVPFYMLTNGKEIFVFERKVDNDVCLFSLTVNNLPAQWQAIEQVLGKR